jgi:hypothetical protein
MTSFVANSNTPLLWTSNSCYTSSTLTLFTWSHSPVWACLAASSYLWLLSLHN